MKRILTALFLLLLIAALLCGCGREEETIIHAEQETGEEPLAETAAAPAPGTLLTADGQLVRIADGAVTSAL